MVFFRGFYGSPGRILGESRWISLKGAGREGEDWQQQGAEPRVPGAGGVTE
jgi:hypothetical protein